MKTLFCLLIKTRVSRESLSPILHPLIPSALPFFCFSVYDHKMLPTSPFLQEKKKNNRMNRQVYDVQYSSFIQIFINFPESLNWQKAF